MEKIFVFIIVQCEQTLYCTGKRKSRGKVTSCKIAASFVKHEESQIDPHSSILCFSEKQKRLPVIYLYLR